MTKLSKKHAKFRRIQIKRAKILDLIRRFFKKRGFLEVQTPILEKTPSMDPYLNPIPAYFEDEKGKNYKGYLITSPEYSIKKLLATGFKNVFEITKAFRGGEHFGVIHNPEFTILEWYRTGADYKKVIKDTEELVFFLTKRILKKSHLVFQGEKVDISLPWPKITVREAFKKFSGIDLDKTKSLNYFKKIVKRKGYKNGRKLNHDELFYTVFLNEIEPRFPKDRPIVVYDYPFYQASLAKRKSKNSFYAERFEVFIGGMEICNGFSELLDWKEQKARFQREQKIRKRLKKEVFPLDEDLIEALKSSISPTAGNALGVDRLQMLLLDIKDIDELLPFPARDTFAKN